MSLQNLWSVNWCVLEMSLKKMSPNERNILAKSPYEILWTLADPLGNVDLLYPMKNHSVDPDRIRACEWWADSSMGDVIFQTPSKVIYYNLSH